MKREFGLIGRGIGHSFSARYFNDKFAEYGIDASYSLFDLQNIQELTKLLSSHPKLMGLNVTSPYKREVIQYLDELSDEAKILDAVNVIEFIPKGNLDVKLKGHNTDCPAFGISLQNFLSVSNFDYGKALVLGTGGASSAVCLALENLSIPYLQVSRSPLGNEISYYEANRLLPHFNIIVNATPVGMSPNVEFYPDLDYKKISERHFCYDLIYNPSETLFLKKCKEKGATVKNGLEMLTTQADLAWNIWNDFNEG